MSVISEVVREMVRQDGLWGEQNYIDFPKGQIPWRAYGIPTEAEAKRNLRTRFNNDMGNWGDILIEEVCEAIGAETEANLREELVQVAAVAVQWAQAIDRRNFPAD